jgi:hypothetical protein
VVLDYARDGRSGQHEPCKADTECDTLRGFKCADGTCQNRTGQFDACTSDAECDARNGFSCVQGECRIPCSSHFECAAVGSCESIGEGSFCKVTQAAKPGQYYTHCPCLGAGPADLDAFCSADCASQDDCPDGYRCGTAGATPCTNQCGLVGQQVEGCVPASEIGPGKRYQCEEPFGLVRRVCVRNTFCAPCDKDEDCFGMPGQICAKDQSGLKICTYPCDPAVPSCPWGDATECGVWDEERGVPTCAHRFGSCRGSGKGCEPCIENADCGARGFCSRSSFTGERFCVDLSVSCNCGDAADANGTCEGHGCPESPGGLPMTCADSSLGKHCFGANSTEGPLDSAQTGCWSAR